MSYIGQAALKNSELKVFNVTSSTSATHVLSWTAATEQSLFVTINGVKQQDDAYSIAGSPTTITLTDALVATDKMEVVGILDIGVITTVGDNSISSNKLANNAVTTGKILDGTIVNSDISAAAAIAVDKLETGTRGDTLFWAADTEASRLAAGTSGYFLKTQGSGADPIWAAAGDAFLATDQNWTGSQRSPLLTDNDGSFDLNARNNFFCTPAGNITLTFTNHISGQSGYILLVNSGHTVSLAGTTKGDANLGATLSTAGTYLVSYLDNGTNAYCTTSAVFA